MSRVSVIMVSYHTGDVLYTAVASVLTQESLAELVLVDNGNPPDVMARMQQMSLTDPRIKVITGHGNVGFAAACNLGAQAASGEYLLLLNPDCILSPYALTTLMQEMEALPNTMLAGAQMLNPDGSEQRGGRRKLLTPLSALGEVFGVSKLNLNNMPMPEETHDVEAVSGACMCIRKIDYQEIGGLDEGYFLHVEDLDLCMRIARLGKRIICVPSVKIAHLLSTSGETRYEKIEKFKAQGFIRYFKKFYGEGMGWLYLPMLNAAIWTRYKLRHLKRLICCRRQERHIAASRKLQILASSITLRQHHTELTGKTVLVTGATSQVGVFVIKHLLATGAAVLAISRDRPLPFEHTGLRWLQLDITDEHMSLGGFMADVAIHCAPQWYLPTLMPVLAASEVKRVVVIGSTSLFSKASSHNHFERELVAKHERAEQHIAAQCASYNINWTILRPTMIYGVGLDSNITSISKCIQRFGRFAVYPPAMGRRQPIHAEDVAIAALQATVTEETYNKSYNISGGEVITYYQMLERIFKCLGKKPRIIETTLLPMIFNLAGIILCKKHITREVAYRMNEDLVFFHDDATRDFHFAPQPFLTGGLKDLGE